MRNKRRRIAFLAAAVLLIAACVFSFSAGLKAEGLKEYAGDFSLVNEDRSQILLTGKKYTLTDEQAEKVQSQEHKRAEEQETPDQEALADAADSIMEPEEETPPQETESTETGQTDPQKTEEKETSTVPEDQPGQEESSGQQDTEGNKEKPTKDSSGQEEESKEEKESKETKPAEEDGTTKKPEDTPDPTEKKEPIIYTTIKAEPYGSDVAFAVQGIDHYGGVINNYYYHVYLDGVQLYSVGTDDSGWVTYRAENLAEGYYEVYITIADPEGNSAELTQYLQVLPEQEEISEQRVSLVVEAYSLGFGQLLSVNEPIYENESAAHFVKRMLEDHAFTPVMDDSSYLSRIYRGGIKSGPPAIPAGLVEMLKENLGVEEPYEGGDPDSLGERDYYATSGWIYLYNGVFMGVGMGGVTLTDGDEIHLGFAPGGGSEYSGNWGTMWDW